MKPAEKLQKKAIGGAVFAKQGKSLIRLNTANAQGTSSYQSNDTSNEYVLKSKNKLVRNGARKEPETLPYTLHLL